MPHYRHDCPLLLQYIYGYLHTKPVLCGCCRRYHVFRFRNEGGRPVVYAREHDNEDAPWVGHPDGGGWPIFLETATLPTFSTLQRQPRTAIQHYKAIEERASQHIKKWRSMLCATAGLSGEGGREAVVRGRYVRAIRWWVDFLADHRARWPQDEDVDATGAALVVEEGGDIDEPDMLPLSHSSAAKNLGPITQRCESPSMVCSLQTICQPVFASLPSRRHQSPHSLVL